MSYQFFRGLPGFLFTLLRFQFKAWFGVAVYACAPQRIELSGLNSNAESPSSSRRCSQWARHALRARSVARKLISTAFRHFEAEANLTELSRHAHTITTTDAAAATNTTIIITHPHSSWAA